MSKTPSTKKLLERIKIDKELNYLFLANIYLSAYIDNAERPLLLTNKLMIKLAKISKLFKGRISTFLPIAHKNMDIAELNARASNNRFKKLIIDSENDLMVHPLALGLELILLHKEMKNKALNLPYKDAIVLYDELNQNKHYSISNARLIASEFDFVLNK